MHKEYIGDSIYAELENGMIKLYTDNGDGPKNVLYLEQETVDNLKAYEKRIIELSREK